VRVLVKRLCLIESIKNMTNQDNEIPFPAEESSLPDVLCPCENVRRTCIDILMQDGLVSEEFEDDIDEELDSKNMDGIRSVSINQAKLESLAARIQSIQESGKETLIEWDEHEWHYKVDQRLVQAGAISTRCLHERVALYIMCLDALNFCFWPYPDLEYVHLAKALARVAQQDEEQLLLHGESHDWNAANYALHPNQLRNMTPEKLNKLMGPYLPTPPEGQQDCFPNMSERARLLSEVAEALLDHPIYKGEVLALIKRANRSASRLVYLVLELFPGFRDISMHPKTGQQLCFYKRAQILVGDLWAAMGDVLGFTDVHKLTMFADYRVPQLLREEGVMVYSNGLAEKIDSGTILNANSIDEIYIRAATVVAVERIVECIRKKHHSENTPSTTLWCAIKVDWYLWQLGESLATKMRKHHCVHTIYY